MSLTPTRIFCQSDDVANTEWHTRNSALAVEIFAVWEL